MPEAGPWSGGAQSAGVCRPPVERKVVDEVFSHEVGKRGAEGPGAGGPDQASMPARAGDVRRRKISSPRLYIRW
jgi:hypothetical protein